MSALPYEREEASSLLPLHQLGRQGQHDEDEDSDLDLFLEVEYANGFDVIDHNKGRQRRGWVWQLLPRLPVPGFLQYQRISTGSTLHKTRTPWKRRLALWLMTLWVLWVIFIVIFRPSYTRLPSHYQDLVKRSHASHEPGRANANNEKIFIAASVYDKDGTLLSGDWGNALLELIDLLGPDNVFLSIYENDASEKAATALDTFSKSVKCKSRIVNEHLETDDLQRVIMPDGQRLLKRIAFLAKVRNQALTPLDKSATLLGDTKFDKLLYVNDVVFDPVDAANLLFSTNRGENGRADYRAACATDFINPFKFYDTFATRDLEGYDMGVPFYPWFTYAGKAESRRDVLDQKDAVRVRSCWGGMVAFDASYFLATSSSEHALRSPLAADISVSQQTNSNYSIPARFRAEEDPFWDASECCLIHADIQEVDAEDLATDTGIYMNPYIRVAYDSRTLSWLSVTRRFERLSTPIQGLLNKIGSRPSWNPRRMEEPGQKVLDRVWVSDEKSGSGSYQDVERIAKPGGFCGGRKLLALPEDGHGGHWYSQPPPPDV